jgi:hypothetical protein
LAEGLVAALRTAGVQPARRVSRIDVLANPRMAVEGTDLGPVGSAWSPAHG